VRLRRLITAASTFVVAIVLALCVPISQLHTVAVQTECCCPDPDNCKCPDHKPDDGTQPMMRACHKTQHEFVAPVLPAFVAPVIARATPVEPIALAPAPALAVPHPAPAPHRPDAPS
jgi:hypothetical protein